MENLVARFYNISTALIGVAIAFVAAVGVVVLNYKLVVLPLMDISGGGDYLTDTLTVSQVLARVLIAVEVALALFLTESTRLTRLVPRVGETGRMTRRTLASVAASLLLVLAVLQAALVIVREQTVSASMSLKQALSSADYTVPVVDPSWYADSVNLHMALAALMPFALVLVPVFVQSLERLFTSITASIPSESVPGRESAGIAYAITRFLLGLALFHIAVGAVFVNIKLISLPMSEVVGGGDYLRFGGEMQATNIAALAMTWLMAVTGLVLLETAGITHVFAVLGGKNASVSRSLMWISLFVLLYLAAINLGLCAIREQIVAESIALKQQRGAAEAVASFGTGLPYLVRMLLYFFMPVALLSVGYSLELFRRAAAYFVTRSVSRS